MIFFFFFFNDTATTEIYTLSLHDALPIFILSATGDQARRRRRNHRARAGRAALCRSSPRPASGRLVCDRSEEHTSELQSLAYLVCRLLLEKKKKQNCVCHYST